LCTLDNESRDGEDRAQAHATGRAPRQHLIATRLRYPLQWRGLFAAREGAAAKNPPSASGKKSPTFTLTILWKNLLRLEESYRHRVLYRAGLEIGELHGSLVEGFTPDAKWFGVQARFVDPRDALRAALSIRDGQAKLPEPKELYDQRPSIGIAEEGREPKQPTSEALAIKADPGDVFVDDATYERVSRRWQFERVEEGVYALHLAKEAEPKESEGATYPHMTARDNMAFPLRAVGLPKREIRETVERTSSMLKIQHLLDRRPRHLSGGEQQRVALGRAAVRIPKVFLMDEPLTNLDAELRADMRVELKHLQESLGVTMVYVTHDQLEAMSLGHRIAILKDGRLRWRRPAGRARWGSAEAP
jgi:ABC-type transporter Mla maintaining outer membrane lipid asymmetry ATPase subunit MlaF